MLKMIDLFAGLGGIRIAFENNGVKCVMSSEIDKYACETYMLNFGEMPSGDITKIDANEIPEFDIIAGGFPCQPFSIGGLRKGFEDTRGTLFFEVARIISERNPKAFFLENVAGLVNHDNGKTLEVIQNTLESLGYNFKSRVMNACHYGIPQNRNRWYCVGFRKDLGIGFEDQNKDEYNKIYQFPDKRELLFTLNDIIHDIDDTEYELSDIAKSNIEKYLPVYKGTRNYNKNNVLIANEIRASRCNFRSDGISPCLTAKMGTGGNNVPVYVKQMRKLTEQECLRIMGFPEWYKIKKNNMNSYKQIGNSVVEVIVEELAKEMVKVLGGK
ncbi:MAG: DNA cytosine methyltransferase [Clostridiales bacterium]|nr:DNA cytosine methyltransferase [Clostridiales bacterium]